MFMISTFGTMDFRGGRLGYISSTSAKGMYFDKGVGSGIGSTSCMSLCPSIAGKGYRNSGRSACVGTTGISAKLLR